MLKVIKFGAVWCGPCKMLNPIFEDLKEYNPNVDFVIIDVDENYEMANKYSIRNVPTVIFEKDGEEVNKLVGLKSKSEYQKEIETMSKLTSDEVLNKGNEVYESALIFANLLQIWNKFCEDNSEEIEVMFATDLRLMELEYKFEDVNNKLGM